ncbi:hypothetical protein RHGRI_026722 [Rhododendron griersonianum]|uniref:Uncharacterized protein n=1 Tax=Rhododendron griersonianum TaxID=479676 RepID=A0AAV6J028_9ERIC|nr:hypothetical protein RHGRI_026722 [Rhododendron griersonianum]
MGLISNELNNSGIMPLKRLKYGSHKSLTAKNGCFLPRYIREPTEQNPNQQDTIVYLEPPCQPRGENRYRRARRPGVSPLTYCCEKQRPCRCGRSDRVREETQHSSQFESEEFGEGEGEGDVRTKL